MMQFRAVVLTDKGLLRANNEDNFYFAGKSLTPAAGLDHFSDYLPVGNERSVFAVCDGMGGESLGEEAAAMGVSGLETIETRLRATPDLSLEDLFPAYLDTVNELICNRMRKNKGLRMGSTFSALVLDEASACTINLGDSRIYLYREDRLYQLTKDQTHAERMVDIGLLTREEADRHPERHRLLQHLGLFPEERRLEPFISPHFFLTKGDRLLLCSDGITEMLTRDELKYVLKKSPDTKMAGEAILELALKAGGKDNASLILIDIDKLVAEQDRPLIRKTKGIVMTPPLLPDSPENSARTRELSGLSRRLTSSGLPTVDRDGQNKGFAKEEKGKMKKREQVRIPADDTGQPSVNRRPSSEKLKSVSLSGQPTDPMTKADWERFELARQAAQERQQQASEQKQVGGAAVTGSPTARPAGSIEKRRVERKDDVINRKPRHHVADGHLVEPPRRRTSERRPQPGQPARPQVTGPAVRRREEGRRPAQGQLTGDHGYGNQAHYYEEHGSRAEESWRPNRGLPFIFHLLIALAAGFGCGWLLFNIGQLF